MKPNHEMTRWHPYGQYEKQCPNCERVFKTDNPNVVYCSEVCKTRANAKTAYQRSTRVRREDHRVKGGQYCRTCPACGEKFRTNTKSAKYCSEACRKKTYFRKYYKRNRRKIIKRVMDNRKKE